MSNQKIRELEQQIAQLKKQQEEEANQQKLQEHVTKWYGKCFATHQLSRKSQKSINFSARRIVDVVLREGQIRYQLESISLTITPDSINQFYYSPLSLDDMKYSWENYKYEITDAQFENIKQKAIANVDLLYTTIKESIHNPTDYITIGDHGRERNVYDTAFAAGIRMLKLDPNHEATQILQFSNCPFLLTADCLIYSDEARKYIEEMANRLWGSASSWGGTIAQRDVPRVTALRKFVKEHW